MLLLWLVVHAAMYSGCKRETKSAREETEGVGMGLLFAPKL
jgi:hypothetical protein